MSKAQLVLTALFIEHQRPAQVAVRYGVHRSWVYKLKARHEAGTEAGFEPRSRRPHSSPAALEPTTVDLILQLREKLTAVGLDSGPDTIGWHLTQHHQVTVSRSTISRYLTKAGLVIPEPRKRPKSSYIRFEAAMPNETWQSDFTHYRLTHPDGTPGADVEIISWLDDCTRYALHVSAHTRITGPIVTRTFRETAGQYGIPASTLTDNGMVYTARFSGGRGGRNTFETELRRLHVVQKNSRPAHPTTCGKVERFQQTMKKWLHKQPDQPTNLADLKALIDAFVDEYNHRRGHKSLPRRATPAATYATMPKALPGASRDPETHDRVRHDRVDKAGSVTIQNNGRLHHIGIGRTYEGTCVVLLVQDLEIRVVNASPESSSES
jgi:transposase InsO family protein